MLKARWANFISTFDTEYDHENLATDVEKICGQINVDLRPSILRSADKYCDRVLRNELV